MEDERNYTARIYDVDMNFNPHIGVTYFKGKADLFNLKERNIVATMEFAYEDSGEPLRYSLSEPLDEDVRVIFGEHVIAELEHWLCAWWGMDFYIIKKMAMVLWNGYGVVPPGNEVNE